jgi:hypothetical protein
MLAHRQSRGSHLNEFGLQFIYYFHRNVIFVYWNTRLREDRSERSVYCSRVINCLGMTYPCDVIFSNSQDEDKKQFNALSGAETRHSGTLHGDYIVSLFHGSMSSLDYRYPYVIFRVWLVWNVVPRATIVKRNFSRKRKREGEKERARAIANAIHLIVWCGDTKLFAYVRS